jgi:hypothetical protein
MANTSENSIVGRYDARQVDLEGSPAALIGLAERLIHPEGTSAWALSQPNDRSAHPYEGFLAVIRITLTDGAVQVTVQQQFLDISGNAAGLATLAYNIRWLAEQPVTAISSDHLHIEFYDDHPYLSPDSWPLIVTVIRR